MEAGSRLVKAATLQRDLSLLFFTLLTANCFRFDTGALHVTLVVRCWLSQKRAHIKPNSSSSGSTETDSQTS